MHEIKHDGYRLQIHVQEGRVRAGRDTAKVVKMASWTKASLTNGQVIFLDMEKATALRRVRGQGNEFTAVFFGANSQPFEITESPETLITPQPKPGSI